MKQGTLAELESDKTGEEPQSATSLMRSTTAIKKKKKKKWQCCLLIANTTSGFFFFFYKYIFPLESCREIFKVKEVNKPSTSHALIQSAGIPLLWKSHARTRFGYVHGFATAYETGFAIPPPHFRA